MSKLLGLSYFFTENYRKAINPLEKVIESEPESDIFHYYLGLVFSSIDEHQKSIKHFEKAIEFGVSKNLAKYYNYLGESQREVGNFENSIRAYKEHIVFQKMISFFINSLEIMTSITKTKKLLSIITKSIWLQKTL